MSEDNQPHERIIRELNDQFNDETKRRIQAERGQQQLMEQKKQQSIIHDLIDISDILEKAEQIFKGYKWGYDNQRNFVLLPPKDETFELMNEYGVQQCMSILTIYVNKNILLGNYTKDEINHKMWELGRRLATLIYCKYETMGFNTPEKRKNYPIIVKSIVDLVHATYMRALNGEERESHMKQIFVSQNENLGQGVNYPSASRSKPSILKPWTW